MTIDTMVQVNCMNTNKNISNGLRCKTETECKIKYCIEYKWCIKYIIT